MLSCSKCKEDLPPENDFVSCGVCKGGFHYGCCGVRETAWRKYSAEVKQAWKCSACKIKTLSNDKEKSADNVNVSYPTDIRGQATTSTSAGTTSMGTTDEILYLKELLRHKDLIIENQKDLITSLGDQVQLMKAMMTGKITSLNNADTSTKLFSKGGPVNLNVRTTQLLGNDSNVTQSGEPFNKVTQSKVSTETAKNKTSDGSAGITKYDVHEALAHAKMNNIINLADGGQNDAGWETVKPRGAGKFKTSNTPIVGKKPEDDKCKLRAATTFSYWHVYRLHPDTTAEEVETYLKIDFPQLKVEKLNSANPTAYSSFKVTTREADGPKILDAGLWPSGTRVNRFFLARKK